MIFPSTSGRDADLRFLQCFLDVAHRAGIEWLHDEQARLGRGDERELFQFHGRAVSLHVHVLDQRGRCLAGPHRGKLVDHVVHAFFHRHFGFEQDFFGGHCIKFQSQFEIRNRVVNR